MARVRKYVPGFRFGRLTVVERLPGGRLRCACDCGGETVIHHTSASHATAAPGRKGRHPGTRSCGCLLREANATRISATTIAARAAGLSPATVRSRVSRGESLAEAVETRARRGEPLPSRDGMVATRAEHARRLGITRQAIDERIKSGWDPQDAISLPRSA